MNVLRQQSGAGWHLYNADTVDVCAALPESSVDFAVFSPPFASLYTYSNNDRDMGNCKGTEDFAEHFAHLMPSLHRALRPGRLMTMHCMLLPSSKVRDGYIGLKNFRDQLERAARCCNNVCGSCGRCGQEGPFCQMCGGKVDCAQGFIFHSEATIWKNPVTAMQRTKAKGLLHMTIRKDSAQSRTGIADFLVVMGKPGDNSKPIPHTAEDFPVERWQRYASPVWATVDGVDDEGFLTFRDPHKGDHDTDSSGIDAGDTLQHRSARADEDERHICPLQLGVIRRAIRLWTAPGDIVFSPFAGIGSEGYVALQEGRRFVGAELKDSYYDQAVRNLAAAEPNARGQTLSMFG